MTNIRFAHLLSNVQGEEDAGGSDQREEYEEVGELCHVVDDGNMMTSKSAFMKFLFQAKRVQFASF